MTLEFKNLAKKDYAKAIDFAIEGMHFDWYLNNPFLLKLYGRYFLYLELNRASHIIAGYSDNQLVGLVLADIYKHPKAHSSFWQNAYIKMADFIQKFFFQDSVGSYDQSCSEFASDCEITNYESFAFHLSLGFQEVNRIICFNKTIG